MSKQVFSWLPLWKQLLRSANSTNPDTSDFWYDWIIWKCRRAFTFLMTYPYRLFHLRYPYAREYYYVCPVELVNLTREVWSKRLGRELSKSEAEEILRSFKNFLILLKEIRRGHK